VSYGWGEAELRVEKPRSIEADGGRLAYTWDERLTEWYVNDSRGLEHGCESCNGKLRDECLNEEHFDDAADARKKIEAWRVNYNGVQPHTPLGSLTPDEFASRAEAARAMAPTQSEDEDPDQPRDVTESVG
jgi:hypothetical protein